MDAGARAALMDVSRRDRRDTLLLLALWLGCLLVDGLWLRRHQLPPAWDQGDHLSRALGFWRVLGQAAPWSSQWWQELWNQSPTYRGPLTYIVTAPVLELLGPSYRSAMAANGLFNGLLLASVYGLGRLIHSRSAGLWAAWLCAVAPALLNQRTDYLIDFSLTAVLSGCWWLLSARRWLPLRRPWLWSVLAGLGLGAVFLTRPTGLVLLWLPLLLLVRHGLALMAVVAWAVSWPWFSQNWLTILSTINKARQWGVAYQDGLEANSLEGWLYYPKLLPTMAGGALVGLTLAGAAVALAPVLAKRGQRPGSARLIWWLSFPLGGLLVCVLMSSKDFRFVLPLLPQLCLGLGVLVASVQSRWRRPWQASVLALGLAGVLWNQFGWGRDLTGFPQHLPNGEDRWPVAPIVAAIRQQSPHQLSTLAVLPDSESLNAFNLEAEGRRQRFRVAARQTVAPLERLQVELNGFDWFLLKGGDQGVMSDERQAELSRLVCQSPAFVAAGRWPLPDGSQAELFRRRQLSLEVEPVACDRAATIEPLLTLNSPTTARPGTTVPLELSLTGPLQALNGARLLLDWHSGPASWRADHALGQGMLQLDALGAGCLRVRERLGVEIPSHLPAGPYQPRAWLLNPDGRRVPLRLSAEPAQLLPASAPLPADRPLKDALATNRVAVLQQLGQQLRRGELDPLFGRVGQLNQTDPEQVYLRDGEAILRARLRADPANLNDLYALALAQALQRQAGEAALTLQRIHQLDPRNPNALLGLGVVELYRFHPWAAQDALDQAVRLNGPSPTLRTLRIVASALRLDLPKALSLLRP
jgi:hypothetical protein